MISGARYSGVPQRLYAFSPYSNLQINKNRFTFSKGQNLPILHDLPHPTKYFQVSSLGIKFYFYAYTQLQVEFQRRKIRQPLL